MFKSMFIIRPIGVSTQERFLIKYSLIMQCYNNGLYHLYFVRIKQALF